MFELVILKWLLVNIVNSLYYFQRKHKWEGTKDDATQSLEDGVGHTADLITGHTQYCAG